TAASDRPARGSASGAKAAWRRSPAPDDRRDGRMAAQARRFDDRRTRRADGGISRRTPSRGQGGPVGTARLPRAAALGTDGGGRPLPARILDGRRGTQRYPHGRGNNPWTILGHARAGRVARRAETLSVRAQLG